MTGSAASPPDPTPNELMPAGQTRFHAAIHSRLRKRLGDRGAAFIEFALALPFLMLMAMGIVEYGLAWKSTNDVNATARDAARAASSAPARLTADRTALITIGSELSKTDGDLEKVVIFSASTTDGKVPDNCKNTNPTTGNPPSARGIGSLCNVYGPDAIAYALAHPSDDYYFGGTDTTACRSPQIDRVWCPYKRNRSIAPDTAEYVGVYIKLLHHSVTNFGFGDQTIERTAVFRLEPTYGAG